MEADGVAIWMEEKLRAGHAGADHGSERNQRQDDREYVLHLRGFRAGREVAAIMPDADKGFAPMNAPVNFLVSLRQRRPNSFGVCELYPSASTFQPQKCAIGSGWNGWKWWLAAVATAACSGVYAVGSKPLA